MKLKAIEFVQLKFSQYRKQDMQDMTLARELKMNFDENFHPTWQCVVGKNYGTEIGFEDGYVIYFYVGPTAILLWKAGWKSLTTKRYDKYQYFLSFNRNSN